MPEPVNDTVKLTSLERKILSRLTFPLPDACPISLRYELAKYDADNIEEAYERLLSLYREGLLTEK